VRYCFFNVIVATNGIGPDRDDLFSIADNNKLAGVSRVSAVVPVQSSFTVVSADDDFTGKHVTIDDCPLVS